MKNTINYLIKNTLLSQMIPKLKIFFKKIRFFGCSYNCPICKSHLKSFLPFGIKSNTLVIKEVIGGGFRLEALCPICHSLDRERLLYLYILYKTNLFSEQLKLLHIAPEAKISSKLKQYSNLNYLTADINSKRAMVKMDITDIEYHDNKFDVIICNHVLEHIVDDRKAMNELYRILKPGGWAILQVPFSKIINETYEDISIVSLADRENNFGQSDHVRIYGLDYIDRLKESGFNVSLFNWWDDNRFCNIKNKYGLLKGESIFIVNKS